MKTGSKHLHSLVNGGALLPVAAERRRNAPKRGGAKVDSAFAESSVAGFVTDVALCVLFRRLLPVSMTDQRRGWTFTTGVFLLFMLAGL